MTAPIVPSAESQSAKLLMNVQSWRSPIGRRTRPHQLPRGLLQVGVTDDRVPPVPSRGDRGAHDPGSARRTLILPGMQVTILPGMERGA